MNINLTGDLFLNELSTATTSGVCHGEFIIIGEWLKVGDLLSIFQKGSYTMNCPGCSPEQRRVTGVMMQKRGEEARVCVRKIFGKHPFYIYPDLRSPEGYYPNDGRGWGWISKEGKFISDTEEVHARTIESMKQHRENADHGVFIVLRKE